MQFFTLTSLFSKVHQFRRLPASSSTERPTDFPFVLSSVCPRAAAPPRFVCQTASSFFRSRTNLRPIHAFNLGCYYVCNRKKGENETLTEALETEVCWIFHLVYALPCVTRTSESSASDCDFSLAFPESVRSKTSYEH